MQNIIQVAMGYVSTAVLVIGALALCVSVIIQVIKSLPGLKQIPTSAVVMVLSILLSVVALYVYAQIMAFIIYWYYIVAAVILGFFVSYIAMFGWQEFDKLKNRMIRKDE